MKADETRKVVREGYARIARQSSSCCPSSNSCCGSTNLAEEISKTIGYSDEEMANVPDGANLGLGCGNPVALASLKGGEIVLDLGSGAGFDCFLAANKVGDKGRVIGVDMTPEMIEKARENAKKGGYNNVEFRLGEIEHLPVADNSVDVIISNCVINLSPDKTQVFKDGYRVLKPGGRMMISDIVLLKELPDSIRNSVEAYIGCVSGAMLREEYIDVIKAAGFKSVEVTEGDPFPVDCIASDPTVQAIAESPTIPTDDLQSATESIMSVKIEAIKFG